MQMCPRLVLLTSHKTRAAKKRVIPTTRTNWPATAPFRAPALTAAGFVTTTQIAAGSTACATQVCVLMGLKSPFGLLEFRTLHCLRTWPCVPARTLIFPILRIDSANCWKNALWFAAYNFTNLTVVSFVINARSDVRTPFPATTLRKYWLSNWVGLAASRTTILLFCGKSLTRIELSAVQYDFSLL